ncbi:hypothetical protein PMAYCL1PPCAC_26356, partial [Pristionchus mayeri]
FYSFDSFYYKLGEISNFIQCMCGLVNLGLAIYLSFRNFSSGRSFLIFVVFYELLYTIPEWLKHYFLYHARDSHSLELVDHVDDFTFFLTAAIVFVSLILESRR